MTDNDAKIFSGVKSASHVLSSSSDEERKAALMNISSVLNERKCEIFEANSQDVKAAADDRIPESVIQRVKFTEEKLRSLSDGIVTLCTLKDPVGKILEKRELDSGFILERKAFPIGVIGMIFEARPDALVQIACLALRSGNGIILKGGSEALRTNSILIKLIKDATSSCSFGSSWIQGLSSREDVKTLLAADGYVDLIIPRGSNSFVRYVMDNTRIPVIGHSDGLCTTYVDAFCDFNKAVSVCTDAKIQYPAACNATETFLVHKDICAEFLPLLAESLLSKGVKIHADSECIKYIHGAIPAQEKDFDTEFLCLECAVKSVSDVEEAVEHILEHGSHHTDAIITENKENARYFISNVDSADVFINCSTRFADGFRFGLGAEVGISTSKIHARGPVGLDGLMTSKWILSGNGETVSEYCGPDGRPFHHRELI